MQRLTMSLGDDLAAGFDALVREQGYKSRSEAMRDLLRRALESRPNDEKSGACVASLSFIYDRHTRALAQRLSEIAHDHHDMIISKMQVYLDHDHCLETMILRGEKARVRALADLLGAERGVGFGELNLIGVKPGDGHRHAHDHRHAGGKHLTPGLVSSQRKGR